MSEGPYDDQHRIEDQDGAGPALESELAEVRPLPSAPPPPSTEAFLNEAITLIAETRAMPMSTTIKVNKDDLLDLLEDGRDSLPEEIRAARKLLRDREAFLAQARQEREDIIDQGRTQAGRMIERQEVVRAAEVRARQIVEEARTEARQLRSQVEDYCDQKLASFEILLDKTARTVQQGREKLLGGTVDSSDGASAEGADLR